MTLAATEPEGTGVLSVEDWAEIRRVHRGGRATCGSRQWRIPVGHGQTRKLAQLPVLTIVTGILALQQRLLTTRYSMRHQRRNPWSGAD